MQPLVPVSITIALVAVLAGVSPALAQTGPTVTVFGNYSAASPAGDTPTMKRLKLEQAIALRDEAAKLQAADGGTLSPEHLSYVRTRAEVIRSGQLSPSTGSLIARR